MKKICMYLMNGMADHEHGYLLTALSSQIKPKYEFCTVALSKEPIITMGGLKITPNYALNEINKEDIIALILTGAEMQLWLNSEQEPILNLAIELLKRNILVAGICGATLGLASKGLLDERVHTSNIEFLLTNFVKSYKGIKNYKNDVVAVSDKNLITASSAGSLLWAKYILENLEIFSKSAIESWYKYYDLGISEYYIEFMQKIEKEKELYPNIEGRPIDIPTEMPEYMREAYNDNKEPEFVASSESNPITEQPSDSVLNHESMVAVGDKNGPKLPPVNINKYATPTNEDVGVMNPNHPAYKGPEQQVQAKPRLSNTISPEQQAIIDLAKKRETEIANIEKDMEEYNKLAYMTPGPIGYTIVPDENGNVPEWYGQTYQPQQSQVTEAKPEPDFIVEDLNNVRKSLI